jgi:hypothetical protein
MVCDQRKRARQSDCHCIACCYRLSASRCNWSEADTGNERGRDGGVQGNVKITVRAFRITQFPQPHALAWRIN